MTSHPSTTQRRTYIGLLASNTILGAAMPMLIILGGLAGLMLAPSPALATFPPSVQTLAGLFATGPFSLLMGRLGRRAGFLIAGVVAILGGLIGLWALFSGSFILLCIAHMAFGAALSGFHYFRFAAAEVVPTNWQPVAISLMLTSGLVAALVGPQVFIYNKDYFAPIPLAGAYAAISVIASIGLIPLVFVRIATDSAAASQPKLNIASSVIILRRPAVWTAVAIGAVSQGMMVLLMAPTPLAMIECGFSEGVAGDVIRWHVVAMFAPSFFTGFLIKRFGTAPVVRAGLLMLIVSAIIAASGITGPHFYGSLILLGMGWNFGFIGATNMLASAIKPDERAVAQGANDTLIALVSTICAFSSGAIVAEFGWTVLALASLPVLVIALLLPGRVKDAETA
ncbi:MAG: MFS transporter [Paracoccaceae bacterium]